MKRKAMYSKNSGRYNFNYTSWNNNSDDGSSHDDDNNNNNNNNKKETSAETEEPPPSKPTIQPPSSLQEAIHQFQQVLWTPSLPKAITILDNYPQVLSHQNKVGSLPLHAAIKCTQSPYRTQMVQLIIERGIEQNVGGVNGRGGLLIRQSKDKRTGLCLLVVGDDKTDILRYLTQRKVTMTISRTVESSSPSQQQQYQQPLLSPQDIIDYQLLHRAAGDPFLFQDRITTIQFLINLCPQALASRNDDGDLPIHHICRQHGYCFQIVKVLFTEGMKYGVYLEKDGKGKDLLNCCIDDHVLRILDCVEDGTVPILQNVIGVVSRDKLQSMIRCNGTRKELFQAWCHVTDKKGRLPLHYATEIGMKYDHELKDIFEANVYATDEVDPVTNLYPFCLAACSDGKVEGRYSPDSGGGYLDLTSIYLLARSNPNNVGY